jgi:hypothetical protein
MKADINYKGLTIENVTMSAVMNYTVSFDIPNKSMTNELAQQLTEQGATISFYTNDVHIIVDKKECKISYKSL